MDFPWGWCAVRSERSQKINKIFWSQTHIVFNGLLQYRKEQPSQPRPTTPRSSPAPSFARVPAPLVDPEEVSSRRWRRTRGFTGCDGDGSWARSGPFRSTSRIPDFTSSCTMVWRRGVVVTQDNAPCPSSKATARRQRLFQPQKYGGDAMARLFHWYESHRDHLGSDKG